MRKKKKKKKTAAMYASPPGVYLSRTYRGTSLIRISRPL